MAALIRFSMAALLLFGLAACDQGASDKDAGEKAEKAVATLPSDPMDKKAWGDYMSLVMKENMSRIRGRPSAFFLVSSQDPEYDGKLEGFRDSVSTALQRGILPRSLVAFASPESTALADLMAEEFGATQPGSLRDVRILFIGKAEDEARVREAVEATGAEFVFHEAK